MRHRSTNEFSEGHDKAYYRLAELSQDAVALQCEGDFVYMNTAGARLLGAQSPDEIIGRPVLDFVHSDSRELVKEGIELLEEKKPAGLVEQKWVRLDGRVIEVEAVAKPIDYMEHSATQFVLKDITESKRTVNRLRKSEIRTRAILDANPDLVFLVDGAGKFLDFHAGDIEQLYVPSGQIVGKNLEDVLSPEVADSASRLIKTALDSGEAQTFEYQLCLSGEPKDFEARITVSGAGEVLILARDVTGLKRMEQKIREGEERFRHVFEQSVDALLVHDDEGRMIDCNAEACRSLGYTREEFLTLSVRDFATNLVSAEGRAKGGTLWQRLMADESGIVTGVHKGEHRRKDGSTFPVEVRLGSVDYGGRRLIFGSARDITEQKSIEDALRESEERFRTLVRYGSDVITVLEVDGTIRYESPAAERVLGYQPEELTGDSVLDYVHPDDYEKLLSTFLEGVATDKPVTTAELRFRHADGAWRYMESIGVNLLDDPNVQGIIVNSRDVTARKQAEERLSKQEERLRRLIEQAADAFFVHDLQGNLIEVNGQACASLGYNREELLSMKVSDIERNLEPGGFESLWGNVLSGGPVTIEGLHWRKDGTEFPVEVRIGMFEAEEGQLMLATARDITGRKKAEEELRESEERFRTIFEQNAIGISIADPERRLLETNAAYQRITGYSGEELSGKEIADLSHPDDVPADESRNREVHAGETDRYHREKRYVRKNGEVIWVRPTISAVRDADGEPQFLIGMVEDITERKTAEATLRRQKEYLDALNEMTLGLVERLEPEDLLENVLARAAGLLETEHGFVCSLTPEGRLELRMGTGFFAGFVGDGIEADAGVAGMILQSGEPFVVNDYPSWPNRVPGAGGRPRAMIGAPLRSGQRVVGAICLAYMEEEHSFGPDEEEVLGRFAELASVALDNARLYAAAQQELAERKVLERARTSGIPRLADRFAQPGPVRKSPGAGNSPYRARRRTGRRSISRPGQLQGLQRQPRARDGRRIARRGGQAPAGVPAAVGHGCAHRRGRVRNSARRKRRGGRSEPGRPADPGRATDPVPPSKERVCRQRQRRHSHRRSQRPSGRPHAKRGSRDVPGEGQGQGSIRSVRSPHARQSPGASKVGGGSPAGHRERRVADEIPAPGAAGHRADSRHRSVGALGASAAGPRTPRRVHPHRGRVQPHHPDRKMDTEGSLPSGKPMAGAVP